MTLPIIRFPPSAVALDRAVRGEVLLRHPSGHTESIELRPGELELFERAVASGYLVTHRRQQRLARAHWYACMAYQQPCVVVAIGPGRAQVRYALPRVKYTKERPRLAVAVRREIAELFSRYAPPGCFAAGPSHGVADQLDPASGATLARELVSILTRASSAATRVAARA
jgi:hypothetical protein